MIVRLGLLIGMIALAACSDSGSSSKTVAPGTAAVRRTSHGVLHVTAADFVGAGFGVGYGYAQDNRCLLARRIAEVNGRLSEQLGPDAPVTSEVHDITYTSLQSDHYYRGWFNIDAIRAGFAAGAPEVRDLARGYAAGINQLLADDPGGAPCEVSFNGPVTVDDVYRMWVATAAVASGELLASFLPMAPPAAGVAAAIEGRPLRGRSDGVGSNAWAIGRDATRGPSSVHLYNPHFPWSGIQRLYLIHVTIPGQLDVMGGALGGFPLPLAGFNQSVAWGLTFSTAARWTAAELKLDGDALSYSVDGTPRKITAETLAIPVRGEATPRQVPFYRAEGAPLLDAPAYLLGWTATVGYTAHDVNATNTRVVEQFLRVAQASSVQQIRDRLAETQGVPWSYTVASDSNGDVLFADLSNAPNLSTADITRCVNGVVGQFHLKNGLIVVDGSRSDCDWSGRMAAADQPETLRSDYVANSNNNYELPNLDERLSGFSPVLGVQNQALSLRASLGLQMIEDRIQGSDGLGAGGFTGALARDVFFQRRNRAAEILVDGIVEDCRAHPEGKYLGQTVSLTEVCDALAGWDRRNTTSSRGAAVFRGLWMQAQVAGASKLFATQASLAAPLTSPSGYSTQAAVRTFVRDALAHIAVSFAEKGIAASVAWGDVNRVQTPRGSFGIAGGLSGEGVFDTVVSSGGFYTFDAWIETLAGNAPDTLYGASYLHSVELGPDGPKAFGVLPYSQATEATSPWYLDQIPAWAADQWFELPFKEAQIAADPERTEMRLKYD